MADLKILVEGYTNEYTKTKKQKENTCSSIVLVKDKDIVMLADPGTLKDQKILVNKLKKEGLTIDDINIVFITHSHIDHYRNIGMFPKAKTIEYWGVWDKDKVEDRNNQITDDIRIIDTLGHSKDSITLLVKTDKGIIAICGDVFWEENFPEEDIYASDNEKLKESRKKILEMADWVIPGHGKMFKIKK